jgi:hypothetical protein
MHLVIENQELKDPLKHDVSRGSPMDGFMLCPGRRSLAADWRACRWHNKYVNNSVKPELMGSEH